MHMLWGYLIYFAGDDNGPFIMVLRGLHVFCDISFLQLSYDWSSK